MTLSDVVIVGGGPSGSLLAIRLARAGARVTLIDGSHPREKPCGGGVTGRALELLDGVDTGALASVAIARARFVNTEMQQSASVGLASGDLVVASRQDLDSLLYRAAGDAGVELVTARATDISADAGHRVVTTSDRQRFAARWIVGADGANSLVRRRVSAPFTRRQLSVATGVYAHGVSSREIVIEMVADPPGYLWSFPRPGHLAIGVCGQADSGVTVDRLKLIVHRWLETTGLARDARLEAYSWPIPSLPAGDFSTLPIAGRGWMTVGDAAGLVDPITREGIFFALQSAHFAADALAAHGAETWRAYQDRVREEIGRDLARAARYKAGFFRPTFARLLLTAISSSPAVCEIMADLVAGTQSYRDLKWRLLRTFEVGLAWKVMTAPRYRDT